MTPDEKTSVIFVCTGNSCRSQMAEGFLHHWTGDRFNALSAGSHPAYEVNRTAIQVMDETGIDIMEQVPGGFDEFENERIDYVITVCDFARDFCPVFQSKDGNAKVLHWSVTDPYMASNDPAKSLEVYREVRDDIGNRIREWLKEGFGIDVIDEK